MVDCEMFNTVSKVDFKLSMYKGFTIIGLGAAILNGLSYEPIEGNVTILAPTRDLDGFNSGFARYIYLKDYDKSVGFENSSISSMERTICDYIKYKDKLSYWDAYEFIEFYDDEHDGDFSELYRVAEQMGIDRVDVENLINSALDGGE